MGKNSPVDDDSALAVDILWGVNAISAEIGRTQRQTYYLLETGKLPAKKEGGVWRSMRSALRQHFTIALTSGEVA